MHVGGPGEQDYAEVQTCSGTDNVGATCRCGAKTPQKVYDQGNGKFYCRTSPPKKPCAGWDQTFDFDPNVWACATKELDDDPKKLAERVKN